MQSTGKSNIPGFVRGTTSSSKPHDTKGETIEPEGKDEGKESMKEVADMMKQMMINCTSQMNAMQNRINNMEKTQVSQNHRNFQPRQNQEWKKKYPPYEQTPPNQLETNNMVIDEVPSYCRPCDEFHKESTCPKFCYIVEQEQMEMNNFVGHPRCHDDINNVGHVHPNSREQWKQAREYS